MKYSMKVVFLFACIVLSGFCVYAQNNEPTIEEKLTVPENATLEEMETFITEAQRFMPQTIKTYEEYLVFMVKKCEAINEAVDRILVTDDLTLRSKSKALQMRIWTCLQNSRSEAGIKSLKTLQSIIDEFKDDTDMQSVVTQAQRTQFTIRMNAFSVGDNTNRDDFVQLDNDICHFYGEQNYQLLTFPATTMLEIASLLYAEESNLHEVIDDLAAKYAAKLTDTDAKRLDGLVRRCKLPGNEMEFHTVTIDVKKLIADTGDEEAFDVMAWVEEQPAVKRDLKSLKDKVVLIDCWATWCGPCLAEVPNMLEQYEKYHDKGFEIVGYSCDQDVKALLNFLIKEKTPWIIGSTVLSEKEGLKHYLNFYGINTIPTMILIGRDGKVISTRARGETLNKLLEEQFAEK